MSALQTTGLTIEMIKNAIGETSTDNSAKNLFLNTKVNPYGFNCPDTNMQSVIYGMDANTRKTLSPSDPGYIVRSGWEPGYHLGIFRGYIYDANKVYKFNTVDYDDAFTNFYGLDILIGVSFASVDPSKSNWNPTPIPIHKYKVYMKRTVGGTWVAGPTYNHINYAYGGYVTSNFFISRLNPIDYALNGPLTSNETFYIKIEHISSPPGSWYNTPSEITGTSTYYYNEGTNNNHGNWYVILKEDILFSGTTTVTLPFKIFSESSTSSNQDVFAKLSKYPDFSIYTSGSTNFTVPANMVEPGVARHMTDNSVVINFPYTDGDVIYYEFKDIHDTYRGQTIVPITGTTTTTTTTLPINIDIYIYNNSTDLVVGSVTVNENLVVGGSYPVSTGQYTPSSIDAFPSLNVLAVNITDGYNRNQKIELTQNGLTACKSWSHGFGDYMFNNISGNYPITIRLLPGLCEV